MTIDDNIRDEKLKYDTNKETPKISAYCQVKLINMKISPYNQSRMVEKAKFTYTYLVKNKTKEKKKLKL